jgi:hypothetical protein
VITGKRAFLTGRASHANVEQVHGHIAVAERMCDAYRRRLPRTL